MANKINGKRKKKVKRTFRGNKYARIERVQSEQQTTSTNERSEITENSAEPHTEEAQCTSFKKLNASLQESPKSLEMQDDFFFFMHFKILKDLVAHVGTCLECNSKLDLKFVNSSSKGFSITISVVCTSCEWNYVFNTSPEFVLPGKDKIGEKSKEINYRSIMAFVKLEKAIVQLKPLLR